MTTDNKWYMSMVCLRLLTPQTTGEEDEEEPTRNWRPPRGDNDYGALAGEHERAALTALVFEMKLCGKDIAVGHGIMTNGFLKADVFRMWEAERSVSNKLVSATNIQFIYAPWSLPPSVS